MSGCIQQRLGPMKKRLKDRIEQTHSFLQQQVTLDESEGKANELLLKLEGNLKSYIDLLEQLQEASKDDDAKTQRRLMVTRLFVISKYFWQILLNENRKQLKGRKNRWKELIKGNFKRKTPTRQGPPPGKAQPRERDSNGKDEVGIENVEAE